MAATTDPKLRFSDRVSDYVRFRPRYPAGLIRVLEERIGLERDWVAADLGAGTGLSSVPFLEHGNPVLAVEPNADMRRALERLLGDQPGFTSVEGSAEATGLDDGSVDLVVAGQAFHWFEPSAARRECRRILRAPGWTVLMWNVRRTDADDFARGYEALLERWGTDYAEYRARRIEPHELRAFFRGAPDEARLPNEQVFDLAGLRGRHSSSSYVPGRSHPDYEPMMRDLHALFDETREDGVVRFRYDTQIFYGRLD